MGFDQKILDRLSRIVGSGQVLTDPEHLELLSWDALSEGRIHPLKRPETALPLCVVLPNCTDEVREIVLLSNEEKVPIAAMSWRPGALSLREGRRADE